jgi:hypothetical protein
MRTTRVWLLSGALLWASITAFAGKAAPVELLTPAEAAQPNLPRAADGSPITGNESLKLNSGSAIPVPGAPQIFVETPTGGASVTAPFPVKIHFVPSAGSKINLESLKVEVLKLVPISLLSRVKPYLTAAGINVPEAKIPAGTYNVHIAVADDQGREGSTVQTWTVR